MRLLRGKYLHNILTIKYLRLLYFQCVSIKKPKAMIFSGPYVEKRTRRNRFFKQIDLLVDRPAIEKELQKSSKREATNELAMQITVLSFCSR